MPYEVPDVTVRQVFETQSPALIPPELTLVLIGQASQLEKEGIAGAYTRGTQGTYSYPNRIEGAIVDQTSIQILLQNDFGRFDVTEVPGVVFGTEDFTLPPNIDLSRRLLSIDSPSGRSQGIFLEDNNVDFLSLGVTADGTSKIVIKAPDGNIGTYVIDGIVNPFRLRVHEETSGQIAIDTGLNTGVMAGIYSGSVISQANIGVIDHRIAQENLINDASTGNTVITQPGIGNNALVNDWIRLTIASPVLHIGGAALAIDSIVADNGSAQAEVTFNVGSSVPADAQAGDRIDLAGLTDAADDGSYRIQSIAGQVVTLTTALSSSQPAAGGTGDIYNSIAGGDGDPAAAGDYRIVAVLDSNTVQIDSPGLLGAIDGTDIFAQDEAITDLTNVGGVGVMTLTAGATPAGLEVGDLVHISGSTTPANDGAYEVASFNAGTGEITFTTAFENDDIGTPATADFQDVNSTNVDQFEVFEVLSPAIDGESKSGDFIWISSGAAAGFYELINVAPNQIVLRTPIPNANATAVSDTYSFLRGIPYVSNNNTYEIRKVESGNFAATVLATYKADRRDLSETLTEIIDVDDGVSKVGIAHPLNPLGLAVQTALANTNNIIYVVGIDSDTISEHQRALAFLESEEAYCLVPLTQDLDNLSLYPPHVTIMSQDIEKRERICLLNRELFVQEQVIPANDSIVYPTDGEFDAAGTLFTSAGGLFQTYAVKQGDDLEIVDGSGSILETRRILSVDSETEVTLLEASSYAGESGLTYRINTHALTLFQQAEWIGNYAGSILNRRVFLIWPDLVNITYSDEFTGNGENITSTQPGYYLSSAIGGMITEQDPQQPFTNVPISGISELLRSNRYFKPSLLDIMAEEGVYICVQDIPESFPFARHQLSTNTTTIEFQELSITKDVDYIAKYVRNNLRPYIGRFNITREYLNQVRTVAQSIIRDLREGGQVLPGTTIRRLVQDPDRPDSVILDLDINVPYPANYIRVTLYI